MERQKVKMRTLKSNASHPRLKARMHSAETTETMTANSPELERRQGAAAEIHARSTFGQPQAALLPGPFCAITSAGQAMWLVVGRRCKSATGARNRGCHSGCLLLPRLHPANTERGSQAIFTANPIPKKKEPLSFRLNRKLTLHNWRAQTSHLLAANGRAEETCNCT